MKKISFIFLAACLAFVSCSKYNSDKGVVNNPSPVDGLVPYEFYSDNLSASVETKADITSLSSFYLMASTGTVGSESAVSTLNNASFVNNSNTYTCSGKYWPATDGKYHFYGSNLELSFAAAGCTVSPTGNSTDVVVAYLPYSSTTYKAKNNLTFNHIYAKVGTITVSAASGYSIASVSYTLKAKGTGTYNVRTNAWSNPATDVNVTTSGSGTYVVPGTYELSVTATVSKGTYSETLTKKANITVQQGKTNNISAVFPGYAAEMQFTVSVTAWGSVDLPSVDLS